MGQVRCGCAGGRGVQRRLPEDPWVGWQERSSHPSAGTGGGGPGKFRDPRPAGASPLANGQSAPYSPVGAKHGEDSGLGSPDPFRQSQPTPMQQKEPNPPPGTVTRTEDVLVRKNERDDINVKLRVFPDRTSTKLHPQGAKTSFDSRGVTITPPVPNYDKDTGLITSWKTRFRLQGTVKIRTEYGTQSSATELSCYGRGTTAKDRKNGDITLGFHESCHQSDYVDYLKSTSLPELSAEMGDNKQEFEKAVADFKKAWAEYWVEMEKASHRSTDEVGYTLKEFEQSKECFLHTF
ncbi:MAG: hypothetical protein QNJ40_19525 [Xanthomonadales bacterium]|nr:hypothetical protein [Xanthomonadales bacterium]